MILLTLRIERKAGVFKFHWVEERFRKAPFSRRISLDGRPDRSYKAARSTSLRVLWTGPHGTILWEVGIIYINLKFSRILLASNYTV